MANLGSERDRDTAQENYKEIEIGLHKEKLVNEEYHHPPVKAIYLPSHVIDWLVDRSKREMEDRISETQRSSS